MANAGKLNHDAVGKHDGGGHELRGFIGGVTEHDTLVPRPLLRAVLTLCRASIHTLGNIRALGGEVIGNIQSLGIEHRVISGRGIADGAHDITHDFFIIEHGLGCNLAGQDNVPVFYERFASNAAGRVLSKAGVNNGVGDEVGNLIRMPLTNGLGGENAVILHIIRNW